jgi:hypothetical protein
MAFLMKFPLYPLREKPFNMKKNTLPTQKGNLHLTHPTQKTISWKKEKRKPNPNLPSLKFSHIPLSHPTQL